MTEPAELFAVDLAGPAARALEAVLPEHVAWAVIELITGSLAANPHRVGKPLRGDLEGRYTARRGAYRVIYGIDDQRRLVTVLRIEHRADVYRPR